MFKLKGLNYPAVNEMLGKWAPSLERSKMGTIASAGIAIDYNIISVDTIKKLHQFICLNRQLSIVNFLCA